MKNLAFVFQEDLTAIVNGKQVGHLKGSQLVLGADGQGTEGQMFHTHLKQKEPEWRFDQEVAETWPQKLGAGLELAILCLIPPVLWKVTAEAAGAEY